MKIVATYNLYSEFILPAGVELLSKEENAISEWGKPGTWGIKWDVLTYFDKNGNECNLEPVRECREGHDFKRPDFEELEEED